MFRTRSYRDGLPQAEGFPITEVSEYLADPHNVVWFDLCAPDEKDLGLVREELGLHSLAVEDAIQPGQRPKVDHYEEHLFLVAYAISVDAATMALTGHEVAVFITRNAIVTVRADEGFDVDAVVRRWDTMPALAVSGVPFLLHGLLDYVVDTHFNALQLLDDEIDSLEDLLFDETASDATLQRRTFQVRKSLVNLRRLVLPMREVVNSLMRRDLRVVDEAMVPYFQDVYDHVLRVTEWTESVRDLLANILETRLTVRGNRLNTIMKKVTSWAAIIAVPTAVTGFYGQNLPYPGSGKEWGFWMSSGIVLGLSGALYLLFRQKDWL